MADLGSAWQALAAGRWADARASFELLAASDPGAEAFEGLSWAAWWQDDGPAVFRARQEAYRRYRDGGDPLAAARMATWLAADELDFHGAAAVAQGWFGRAHRLLDPLEPSPEHGWLAFHEGFVANERGERNRALECSELAASIGRRFRVPDLEMLGLALQGAVLVASSDLDRGMRCLDEASVSALESAAEIPISSAWTFCFLVSACSAVLDYERALQWTDRIAEFADRYGSRYMLAFCRAEYGTIELWRGRWEEADRMLSSAMEDFSAARPAWAAGPAAQLAELRRRQGRVHEADRLLDQASGSAGWLLCRARLALDRGAVRECAELVERLLRQVPADRPTDRIWALELLVSARVAGGDLEEAARALGELATIALQIGTAPLLALRARAEGVLEAARGDLQLARRALEDASDGFRRSDAPYEAARTEIELAGVLLGLGRRREARSKAGAARRELLALGARTEAGRAELLLASPGAPRRGGLTPRESEVLRLLAGGLTNKEIAGRLVLSEHTVHRHVTSILRKLQVPSRAAAAAVAARDDLGGAAPG